MKDKKLPKTISVGDCKWTITVGKYHTKGMVFKDGYYAAFLADIIYANHQVGRPREGVLLSGFIFKDLNSPRKSEKWSDLRKFKEVRKGCKDLNAYYLYDEGLYQYQTCNYNPPPELEVSLRAIIDLIKWRSNMGTFQAGKVRYE